MGRIDVGAKHAFSPKEARRLIDDLMSQIHAEDPLRLAWVRETAAHIYSAEASGGVVITSTRVHITLELPWYLGPLVAMVEQEIREGLQKRGFDVIPVES